MRRELVGRTPPAGDGYPVTLWWSLPGRRTQWPHGMATTFPANAAQRHTLRASYRVLRAAAAPHEARMAVLRLVGLGAGQGVQVAHSHPREERAS